MRNSHGNFLVYQLASDLVFDDWVVEDSSISIQLASKYPPLEGPISFGPTRDVLISNFRVINSTGSPKQELFFFGPMQYGLVSFVNVTVSQGDRDIRTPAALVDFLRLCLFFPCFLAALVE
jgi:hypothetical protein